MELRSAATAFSHHRGLRQLCRIGNRRLDVGGEYNVALTPGPGNYTARQPYPQFSPTYWDKSIGNGSYNALQLQLNRRFSSGLAATVAYTFSKSIDEGCSGFFGSESCSVQQIYNIKADRSVSGFDIPHNLTFSWDYAIPVGKGMRFSTGKPIIDYIIGNWQLNGLAQLHSGTPYTLHVSGDIANVGNSGIERPNLVGDPNIADPTRQQWFNLAAFQTPALYTYGNLGRNTMRAEYVKNLDMSLFRDFPIKERLTIQFRGEALNIFNNTIYNIPAGLTLGQPTFGTVTGTATSPRNLQLGLKLIF